jgi:hypothetical protein
MPCPGRVLCALRGPLSLLVAPWQIPALEVWFQRASDVVRKLRYGDIDLGIVGADMCAARHRACCILAQLPAQVVSARCGFDVSSQGREGTGCRT